MTSRRQQRDSKPDPLDVAALEHELHGKQPRHSRRVSERSAARAEAASIVRPTGQSFTGRPVA